MKPVSILLPHGAAEQIMDISPEQLRGMGIKALILDADNTLSSHASQIPFEGAVEGANAMRKEGFSAVIVSNNFRRRVEPFAAQFGLPFISMAMKPFPFGYLRAVREMGVSPKETAAIGDQVFTDILGAKLSGVYSILVTPQGEESVLRFGWRRRLEQPVRRKVREKGIDQHWRKRGGRHG